MPEVLTRDIISPVKRSVAGLDKLIKTIEERQVSEKILPLLPDSWAEDILYYTQNEFADRVILNGKSHFTTTDEINAKYNINGKGYKPIDGAVLKGCDHLAAFMEGWLSIKHGITSAHLEEGVASLRQQYCGKTIGGINFSEIYAEFI